MRAKSIRLEWVTNPQTPSGAPPATRFMLHATVGDEAISLNLGNQLRPLIGSLRPNRRAALEATKPHSLTIVVEPRHRGQVYLVDRQELGFWVEDALRWLSEQKTTTPV